MPASPSVWVREVVLEKGNAPKYVPFAAEFSQHFSLGWVETRTTWPI